MVARSLESWCSAHFKSSGSSWSLFSHQMFQQILEFSSVLHSCMNVCMCLNFAFRHAWDFDFLSAWHQNKCGTSHELWNVGQTED